MSLLTVLSTCLLLCASLNRVQCVEYYVTPDTDTTAHCPPYSATCLTLQQYAQDVSTYFTSNTVFYFLTGNHLLNISIFVAHQENLTLTLATSSVKAIVQCVEPVSLNFFNVSNMVIEGLEFADCGSVNSSAIYLDLVTSVNLTGLTLRNSSNNDVLGHNVNHTMIEDCNFGILPLASEMTEFLHHLELVFDNNGSVSQQSAVSEFKVWISNSHFYSSSRGGIHIRILESPHPVAVYIDNITALGPFRDDLVLTVAYRATVLVAMDSVHSNRLEITNSRILYSRSRAMIFTLFSNGSILIRNCTLHQSKGGALAVIIGSSELSSLHFVIQDSVLSHNSLYGDTDAGSALLVQPDHNIRFIDFGLEVTNTSFDSNLHINTLGLVQSTVYLADVINASFLNCRFHSNMATALLVARGFIHISGYMEFYNNSGYQGGGIALYGYSFINIDTNDTLVNLTSNQATNVGGGVFVLENFVPFTQPFPNPCFFRTRDNVHNTSFLFINNTAMNGGNAIYGESIENCTASTNNVGAITGREILTSWPMFYFDPSFTTDISVISSDPTRVCVCEGGMPNCNLGYILKSVIPGQAITVSLVTVGQMFGAVSGSVYAKYLLPEHNHVYYIEERDRSQATSALQCMNISFTLSSTARNATVVLTSENVTVPYLPQEELEFALNTSSRLIQEILLSYPVYINVSFEDCPLGSVFRQEYHGCVCRQELTEQHISCNILEQTITLPGRVWVNVSFNSSGEQVGVIVEPCQLQYCNLEENDITLKDPDTQCAHNRSGTLCGGCQSGLSLTLGPPTCKSCSNNYLGLLVLFIVNGFLLVFFIKLLNLTVSQGTINGFIFYANIVWAKRFLFFDTGRTSFQLVFIAWLNLDFGVQACFYHRMNMYALTWLQYAFPFYIWFIALLIIIAARYSSRMAKIFGTNSVQVLATLFLLTYNKILRNIINSLNVTKIKFPEDSSKLVWTHDGNYEYLGSHHVYLFIAAIVFLLFAWLPYTVTLLFGQCLLRLPHSRLSGYLKPFLDAYYGPLKDRYRFWVGLLLLLRSAILLEFALNPQNTGALDLLVIFLVAVLLIYLLTRWGGVYKNKYVGQLETSFLLNLAVLAGVQMYVLIVGSGQRAATETSVSIVFLKFVLILLFHIYCKFRNFIIVRRFETKIKKWLPDEMSTEIVRTITLSESLQIESVSSAGSDAGINESASPSPPGPAAGIRRYLRHTTNRARPKRSVVRGHRARAVTQQQLPKTNVSFSVVGDSMETDMSQVQ